MTPATSVAFFRPEFDDFLYATIGADRNEMPLSVLSAFARLHLDPWEEADELSQLSSDTAAQRLALSIARLPGGRWTHADSRLIAIRLLELLPRRSSSAVRAENDFGRREVHGWAKMLICVALGLTALLIIAANREPSSRSDFSDQPTVGIASPPQTPPASSR